MRLLPSVSIPTLHNGMDILINMPGVMLKKPLAEVSEDEFDSMFNVHTKGTYFCLCEAARHMNDDG